MLLIFILISKKLILKNKINVSFPPIHIPHKCSFSLLTVEFSLPVKLFSFQANDGAEMKATYTGTKFPAVSKSTHVLDLLQQRMVELR